MGINQYYSSLWRNDDRGVALSNIDHVNVQISVWIVNHGFTYPGS